MNDFIFELKNDLIEQFRGKERVEAIIEVIGYQLQEVYDFFEQLLNGRSIKIATGEQLDKIGDIVLLSRKEAKDLTTGFEGDMLPDNIYRTWLLYKILKNTGNGTYPEIIKALRMIWDKPVLYSEEPQHPATMILSFDYPKGNESVKSLINAPIIRPGGVGVIYRGNAQDTEHKLYSGFALQVGKSKEIQCAVPE